VPKHHSPKHRSLRVPALALFGALILLAAACGGGGDSKDSAKTRTTGDPHNITIWSSPGLQTPLDAVVQRYKRLDPDVNIDVLYAAGPELNDRLLQGDQPDLYLSTAVEVNQLAQDKTVPDEQVDFGQDTVMLIVPPGNPGNIADVAVFGLDPLTRTALCDQKTPCGRGGRAVLINARVTASPDVTVPDPKALLQLIAAAGADAGLVYRTDAVKARQRGLVSYVGIPTKTQVNVPYQFAVIRHGEAADGFLHYVETSSGVPKILAQAGLAPLAGDPQ
jgi:molybdate transport system substrate-binding protein